MFKSVPGTTVVLSCLLWAVLLMPIQGMCWDEVPAEVRVSTQVTQPEWSRSRSIYEVNLRQYTPEGTIAAFRKHLPRLKKMGVGILWFMPIHPIGELNRKGSYGSYYSVKDYQALDPGLGTMDEFMALVQEIHRLDMYVLIDWVANHCAWDNVVVTQHPDWITRNEEGVPQPPVADWSDVVDFNYDQKPLWDWMNTNLEFWLREADIDGYRCDVAGMVPTEFWNYVRPRLDAIKEVFMLAEWEDPRLHAEAFNMSYAWGLHGAMNNIAKGEAGPAALDSAMRKWRQWPEDAYQLLFTSNHDENSWNGTVFERMGDAAEAMAVLSYTLPGMPLVYSGQEAGLAKRLSFFDKDLIPWKESPWEDLYTWLNRLKRNHSALWNGSAGAAMRKVDTGNPACYAFERSDGGSTIRVVVNLDKDNQVFRIAPLTGGTIHGRTSTEMQMPHGGQNRIPGWGWSIEILARPENP